MDWLHENIACDLFFTGNPQGIEANVRNLIGERPIDIIIQKAENRRKALLISDMDSTMITVECIDEIADFAGVKAKVSTITERAMRGELDFEAALIERVGLLAGLPASLLEEVYASRVTLMGGAKELVATMRKHGSHCLLVSGGFTFFTDRVQEALGFHSNLANTLEIKDGKLTGRVILPILGKEAKLEALQTTTLSLGINLSHSLAVGDGANDLPMIMAAGLGAAYHAKPIVQEQAAARINHCDLIALLYAQGYKQAEIG